MGAADAPDVRDALVDLLALEREGRRRHAPACHHQLTNAVRVRAHDRRGIVGEDPRQRRQVADAVAHRLGQRDDRLLALGLGVEVAHGERLAPPTLPVHLLIQQYRARAPVALDQGVSISTADTKA